VGVGAGEQDTPTALPLALARVPTLRPWFILPPVSRFYSRAIPLCLLAFAGGHAVINSLQARRYGYSHSGQLAEALDMLTIAAIGGTILGVLLDQIRASQHRLTVFVIALGPIVCLPVPLLQWLDLRNLTPNGRVGDLLYIGYVIACILLLTSLLLIGVHVTWLTFRDFRRRRAMIDAILDNRLDPDEVPRPWYIRPGISESEDPAP
jgi:hypothetical protein